MYWKERKKQEGKHIRKVREEEGEREEEGRWRHGNMEGKEERSLKTQCVVMSQMR